MRSFALFLRKFLIVLLLIGVLVPESVHAFAVPGDTLKKVVREITPQEKLQAAAILMRAQTIKSEKLETMIDLPAFFAEAEKRGVSRTQAAFLLRDFVLVLGAGGSNSAIQSFERRHGLMLKKLFGRNDMNKEIRAFAQDMAQRSLDLLIEDALADPSRPVEAVLGQALTETFRQPAHRPLTDDLKRYGVTPEQSIALLKRIESVVDPSHTWRTLLNKAVVRLVDEIRKREPANKIVSVTSEKAGDIYVTFAVPFHFDALRKAWLDKDILLSLSSRGESVAVRHLAQENPRVLRIGVGEEQALEEAALVTIGIEDLRQNKTFATSYASFVVKDARLPAFIDAKQIGTGSFLLEFNEPIYTGARNSGFEFWKLNGYEIDGRLTPIKPETSASRLSGDFRRFATLELNQAARSRYKPSGEMNKLEGFGIADYAGQRTGRRANGVLIEFKTPKPTEPVPNIVMQSPEQFALQFPQETVSTYGWGFPLGAEAIRFERQNGWDEKGNPVWTTENVKLNEDIALGHDHFTTYYLHARKDWTRILQTRNGGPSYDTSGYNRVRITLLKGKAKDAGSTTTNAADSTREFVLAADTQPPQIKKAVPVFTPFADQETLDITFDEPVQIPGATTQLTPEDGGVITTPVFEFVSVKTGERVRSSVIGYLTAKDDMTYKVAIPDTVALQPGRWEVQVKNLSDDAGNIASTLSHSVPVNAPLLVPAKKMDRPALLWGVAIDNTDGGGTPGADEDVVILQFNTILSTYARERKPYLIAGHLLPATAKILKRSVRIDSNQDDAVTDEDGTGTRITLLLPKETFGLQDGTVAATPAEGVHFNVQVKTEAGADINKWGSLPYLHPGISEAESKQGMSRYMKAEAAAVDYAWLNETIRQADAALSAAHVGEEEGEFPEGAVAELRQAINSAKRIARQPAAGRGEIDEAMHGLYVAQTKLYASQHRLPADKWELIIELRIAKAEWQGVKENPYQYPPALSDKFAATISRAEAVLANDRATEQEIRDAYRELVYVVNEKRMYDTVQ